MSKFFFLVCGVVLLNAIELKYWDYGYTYKLKKDQVATILIQKRDPSHDIKDSNLSFRWTLFKNRALILLAKYEDFPTQYTLYPDMKKDSVKIDLDSYTKALNRPYLLLRFSNFDKQKEIAVIETFIKDPTKNIKVKWIEEK